jgi:hypothetical protein
MNQKFSKEQEFWQKSAKQLSRRINLGWFLQMLSAPLLVTTVFCSIIILLVRRELPSVPVELLGLIIVGIILVLVVIVGFLAGRRFENSSASMIRIEASQRMDSALSAASVGVRPWPHVPGKLSSSLSWHLPKVIAPPLVALAILAVGLFIPISAKTQIDPPPSSQPQAWNEIESQLEKLTEEAMVDDSYIEEMEKRLEQLRAQDERDWFSHSSLEATDSLKETQRANIDKLQQDLTEAQNSLESLNEKDGALDSTQRQKLAENFEKALEDIQKGEMKPNPELLEKLSQLDPENLGNLSPEKLEQLKENMQKLQESLENAQQGEGQEEDWNEQLLGDQGEGNCENGNCKDGNCLGGGECKGEGDKPGNGGVDRGPGHDPNVLKNEKEVLDVGELTSLEAKDLSRATPGDLLQIQDGEHTRDGSASVPSIGGDASKGSGGDRIWRESLAPDEQRALKKYFE